MTAREPLRVGDKITVVRPWGSATVGVVRSIERAGTPGAYATTESRRVFLDTEEHTWLRGAHAPDSVQVRALLAKRLLLKDT